MEHHDLLVEIFTEELPPKRLSLLESAFANSIRQQLADSELSFSHVKSYATPRRLAVVVEKLAEKQLPQKIEHKGPSVTIAFDANKNLTPAGLGFLKKCGITEEQLSTTQTDKGECLYFAGEKPGLSVDRLIPEIIKIALKDLPIPKPMRWANHDFTFIRPVHSVILLYGERVIEAEFFGLKAHRCTQGHRQLSHGSIDIGFPENYAEELENQGCVIVDGAERKTVILEQIQVILKALSEATKHGELKIAITDQQDYENLLNEVTALVEWPKVLLCRFDEKFLDIPKEALMASMQGHQKCFAISDSNEKLLPYFITVSNLQSEDEMAIIRGNERVMRARLSDATFFYETDFKTPLENYIPRLETTIYQEKLGTLADKVERVKKLAVYFSEQMGANAAFTARATELCKLDLFSQMVGEFPELQGVMGKYYALHENEAPDVANAIEEHYWPRFSDDRIPTAPVSVALALADRIDTIVGFFNVGLIPTGDKDPFGLKRAALGTLKIIIKNKLGINLYELLKTENVIEFFKERLKTIIIEENITVDVFNALSNVLELRAYEISCFSTILQEFKSHPAASAIIQANKRAKNLLAKNDNLDLSYSFNMSLCEKDIEKELSEKITSAQTSIDSLIKEKNYLAALSQLAELKPLLDQFFDEVMVMTDDIQQRNNRLALLKKLCGLFAQMADFSELQP